MWMRTAQPSHLVPKVISSMILSQEDSRLCWLGLDTMLTHTVDTVLGAGAPPSCMHVVEQHSWCKLPEAEGSYQIFILDNWAEVAVSTFDNKGHSCIFCWQILSTCYCIMTWSFTASVSCVSWHSPPSPLLHLHRLFFLGSWVLVLVFPNKYKSKQTACFSFPVLGFISWFISLGCIPVKSSGHNQLPHLIVGDDNCLQTWSRNSCFPLKYLNFVATLAVWLYSYVQLILAHWTQLLVGFSPQLGSISARQALLLLPSGNDQGRGRVGEFIKYS